MGPDHENMEGAGLRVFVYQPKTHVSTGLNVLAHCRGKENVNNRVTDLAAALLIRGIVC